MQQAAKSVKEAAQDVRNFLVKSREARKENANKLRKGIQARVQEIKKNTQDFISDSASRRTAEFRAMMKDIVSEVGPLAKEEDKETASEPATKKRGRKKK